MTILRGGSPDRFAWSPLIDGYFLSAFAAGTDVLDVFREIGADVMERHVCSWDGLIDSRRDPGVDGVLERDGRAEYTAGDVTVTLERIARPNGTELVRHLRVPGRTLTDRALYTESSPWLPFPVEPLVKDCDDLEAYRYVVSAERFVAAGHRFLAEDARIGEAGIATDTGPITPIQTLLQHVMGIESFYTRFYLDHREEVDRLMDSMHEKNLELCALIAASPAEVVISYENTSTSFVSPELYERYSLGRINDYADILHERDKIFLTHRCGTLRGLLDLLEQGNDDGIADISPEPTGDLAIWEAKDALPGKVVVGGVDATFLSSWTAAEVGSYARQIMRLSRGPERIVVGSADAVPKDAQLENLAAVGESVRGSAG